MDKPVYSCLLHNDLGRQSGKPVEDSCCINRLFYKGQSTNIFLTNLPRYENISIPKMTLDPQLFRLAGFECVSSAFCNFWATTDSYLGKTEIPPLRVNGTHGRLTLPRSTGRIAANKEFSWGNKMLQYLLILGLLGTVYRSPFDWWTELDSNRLFSPL